jgi:hypothetical protein
MWGETVDAFATLDELKQRLDWDLDPSEERIATAALADASDEARLHGRDWPTARVPRLVRTVVLKAVVRYLRNPDGYTTSRAGDETLTWTDRGEAAGAVTFTRDEIALLRRLAGKDAGLTTAPVVAWSTRPALRVPGYVPVAGSSEPFPMFAGPDDPW